MFSIKESYSFQDILLIPAYSEIKSRDTDVDVSVRLGDYVFSNPIIPANMKSVTGESMAKAVAENGGLAIVHRFMPLKEQLEIANRNIPLLRNIGFSLGVKEEDYVAVGLLYNIGVRIFCIDIAHGHSKMCCDMIKYIKENFDDTLLIAGNVATGEGAKMLWECGADVVKTGIGSGAICSTRIQTGNGVPQMSALMDVAEAQANCKKHNKPCYFISDGGILSSGDCVKALTFADMVMTGKLFSGCSDAPGEVLYDDNGKAYKEYAGSSTINRTKNIEGVVAHSNVSGNFKEILEPLLGGIRSGISYQGVSNLTDLKDSPQFVKISSAGLEESKPHYT